MADTPSVDAEIGRLTCRLTDVSVLGEALGFDIRLYLRGDVSTLREIAPGQRVSMTGHFWSPDEATNPGQFDFAAYLWRSGVAAYATAELADAAVSGEAWGFAAWLHRLRTALGERIDALFPRSADMVRALVLGDRGDMEEGLRESFDRAGVTHVLSISGLHITMLAMAMMALLGSVPAPALGVLADAHAGDVSTGCWWAWRPRWRAPSSCTRRWAQGRRRAGRRTRSRAWRWPFCCCFSGNRCIWSDAGFVLSFAACAGMLCLTPALTSLLRLDRLRVPEHGLLRPSALLLRAGRYFGSLLCATLAAQLSTLPAVIAYYGQLPLLATVGNLVIVPVILAGMYLAVAALLLSFLWLPLGAFVAALGDVALLCLDAADAPVRRPAAQRRGAAGSSPSG